MRDLSPDAQRRRSQMNTTQNGGRQPARNLLRQTPAELAAFVYQRLQKSRGRRTVSVDDNGGMVIYAPNDRRMNNRPGEHLIGNYGRNIKQRRIELDLQCRLDELAASR